MNILIQAWACSPDKGGEYGVSWGWISKLDKKVGKDDRIYVLSYTLKESQIQESNLKHVQLINVNRLNRIKFLEGSLLYYTLWQIMSFETIKRTKIKFDIIHVYSLSDFRQPGYWYKFKDAITVFGPVGGGQDCPVSLRQYDDSSQYFRRFINLIYKINPIFLGVIRKYSKVYACNYETAKYLPNSEILIDVPLEDTLKNIRIEPRHSEKTLVLSCGRLLNKKGWMMLIDIIHLIPESEKIEVHIYGEGPMRHKINLRIIELGLQDRIILKGYIPHHQMTYIYQQADIFILPSLRESGGSVLIEAMAHGLPIVALDMAMSSILKTVNAGIFINTNQNKNEIITGFSEAICKLHNDREQRLRLGNNGFRYVNQHLCWDMMLDKIYGDFLYDKNNSSFSKL